MNEWQKKMIDVISTHFDCADCPLDDKECKDEDWANCEEFLSHLLFQESYPNISEEKCKRKEKEDSEETTKEKKEDSEADIIWRLVHGINTELRWEKPQEEKPFGKVTIHMGDFLVDGAPRDIAEFLKQAGESFAP